MTPDIAISLDVLRNWQRLVDLLANIMRVPSAVVTKLEPPDYSCYQVIVSSDSEGNPFPIDEFFGMDIGTFCETVIKSRAPLLVADAREDDLWKSAPEVGVGMVSYLGFPVLWPDGRIFGTICVLDGKPNGYTVTYQELLAHCRDVLQGDLQTLARLGDELEQQRAQLGELFARVPEAVVMTDCDSRIARVNPEFTKIFGYTAAEAIGLEIASLVPAGEKPEEVERLGERNPQRREVVDIETVRRHKNGSRIPVIVSCVPIASSGSGIAGYAIYRDISATTRLRDEQRRNHDLQLELAHANRFASLGQLSASIAHELNQPLTGIITNCGTCLRTLASEPLDLELVEEAVRRAMRDGNRAADVVARLRALFNKKPAPFEPVDINEAIRDVIASLLDELQGMRVIVRVELDDDLRRVSADRVQLQQVVLNLVRNAMDAMKAVDDRPRDLLVRTEVEPGDRVRLSVRDAGSGFDPQTAKQMFDAFYTTKDEGMGIGLSVSHSIIESHHGRLWATVNDGPGATFSFSIPCQDAVRDSPPT